MKKTITKLILILTTILAFPTFAAYNAKIVQLKADKTVVAKGDIINLQVIFKTGGTHESLTASVSVTDADDNIWSGSSTQSTTTGDEPYEWDTSVVVNDVSVEGGFFSTKATLGNAPVTGPQLTVVTVEELQYKGKDINGETYGYAPNTNFTLTAITKPEGYGEDLLSWSGGDLTGSGFSKEITNLLQNSAITVTCGSNSTATKVKATFNIASTTMEVEDNCNTNPNSPTDFGCMENRTITYKTNLTNGQDGKKRYTFYVQNPDGSYYSNVEDDNDAYEDKDRKLPSVPDGSTIHYYDSKCYVTVTGSKIIGTVHSPTKVMRVWELYIEYFKDSATNKPWKVCVGENISYSALSSANCTNWDWDMEDGFPDKWNPTGGNSKSGNDMVIPIKRLKKASNKWFGEAYGTVNVQCKDGDGNVHRIYSTALSAPKPKSFPLQK